MPPDTDLISTVRVRPDKSNWFGVAFFGVIGLTPLMLPFVAPPLKPHESLWRLWGLPLVLSSLYWIPISLLSWWLVKAKIVADAEGLRWRGMIKEYQARGMRYLIITISVHRQRDAAQLSKQKMAS